MDVRARLGLTFIFLVIFIDAGCAAVGVCTNKPTPWAINNGWTCQTYVNNGLDMTKYCKSATWKANKNCGITCAKFGMVTDPNCDDGWCSNKPTQWAINKGWTCQTYVDKGLDMKKYCTSATWTAKHKPWIAICGKTCAENGFVTDPDCGNKKRIGYEEIEIDEKTDNMDNDKIMALDNEMYRAGGFIRNLASQGPCEQYWKDGIDLDAVMKAIGSNCECDDLMCRDLIIVPIPHPISTHFQLTCKQTATADCKSSVQDLFSVWIKVPTKDDKICSDLYNRTKIWATSCN